MPSPFLCLLRTAKSKVNELHNNFTCAEQRKALATHPIADHERRRRSNPRLLVWSAGETAMNGSTARVG